MSNWLAGIDRPGLGSRESVLDDDENLVTAHLNVMRGDRFDGWHAEGLAGADVEPSSVAGALDRAAVQLAFREWSAVMSADVVNRVDTCRPH